MQLVLGVKRDGMQFHAAHGPFTEVESVEKFLEISEVQRIINNCKRFGDGCIVIELEEDESKPNKKLMTIC